MVSGLTVRPKRGLASRLAWSFILLAGILLLTMGTILILVSYNAQREQVVIRQQKTANEIASLVSTYLAQAQNALILHSQAGKDLLWYSAESQTAALRSILELYPGLFEEVILLDEEGNELARVSQFHTFLLEELGSQADSPAFRAASQGQPYIAHQVQISPYSSLPVLDMAAPVQSGTQKGVLLGRVSIKNMWNVLAQAEIGESGYVYIVDSYTGQLIAHSDLSLFLSLQGHDLTHIPIVRQAVSGQTEFTHQYRGLSGEPVIGAATPFTITDWTLIAEIPTREALAGVRQMIYLLIGLILVGVLIAAVLGAVIPRRIVQPLLALQKGAQEIGRGNLDYVVEVKTGDEIQDLAESINDMAASLKRSRQQLERWGRELEVRVEERTRELAEASARTERRAMQLQIVAEVAHAIASVRDLDRLLSEVTRLISERFGWYHVGVFLLDDRNEYAILQAANSEGGKRMLKRGHMLRVGQEGIVGIVAGSGQPRIALDVGEDAIYFDNPDLPLTRSEMALPLKVGERVIGVLDVQSTEPAAYDEADISLLGSLANQIAVAIENVRLLERTRQALEEVRRLHRRYVQREWTEVTEQEGEIIYEYTRLGHPLPPDALLPEIEIALQEGDVVALPEIAAGENGDHKRQGAARAALAAPIKIRDQIIGVVDLHEITGPRRWTEDEISLVRAISDQMALALENARLFAQTQRALQETESLYRAGVELNAAQNYDQVLQALRAHTLLGKADHNISLNLFNRPWQGDDMPEWSIPVARWGTLPPGAARPRYPLRAFPSARHLLSPDHPTLITDIATDPRLDENARYLYLQVFQGRSTIFVPLTVAGEWIGYVNAIYTQPTEFPEAEVRHLMSLAGQAAVLVQNLRRLQEIEARARREALIREIGAKVSRSIDLETVLQTAVRELGQALGVQQAFIRMGTPPTEGLPEQTREQTEPIDE